MGARPVSPADTQLMLLPADGAEGWEGCQREARARLEGCTAEGARGTAAPLGRVLQRRHGADTAAADQRAPLEPGEAAAGGAAAGREATGGAAGEGAAEPPQPGEAGPRVPWQQKPSERGENQVVPLLREDREPGCFLCSEVKAGELGFIVIILAT